MSSPTGATPTTEYRLLICHPKKLATSLLFGESEKPVPPSFTTAEPHFWQSVGHINRAVKAAYGLKSWVLRFLDDRRDGSNGRTIRYYALELAADPQHLPAGLFWDEASRLSEDADRAAWERWRWWLKSPRRQQVAWYAPGWREATVRTITAAMEGIARRVTGPIEQVRSWERSAILRIPTAGGFVYFKQVPPMFAHEYPLTELLWRHFPAYIPRPLLADQKDRWMILPDLGERTLHQIDDVEKWGNALHQYSLLQRSMAGSLASMRQAGVPDRPVTDLAAGFSDFLADGAAGLSADHLRLDATQFSRLLGLTAQIEADATRLVGCDIPPSIEHGDFWGGQIVTRGDQLHLIDWSDASISHPFFSLAFLDEAEGLPPGLNGSRQRIVDAYLSAWEGVSSQAALREAYRLAGRLAPLHHALIYHKTLLPRMAVKEEMHNMVPFYLLDLLRRYAQDE